MRSFVTDSHGAVGVFFAVGFVGILGIAAIAADHAMWLDQRSDMQSIADAAALAGARDFAESGSVKSAERITAAYLKSKSIPKTNYKIRIDEDRNLVETSVSMPGKQYLSAVIKTQKVNLSVMAQAQASESARPCIIALEPGAARGIDFSLAGSVAAYDCAIWSNATSASSFDLNGSGTAFSSQNCAVGGISGNSFAITPPPQAKCSPAIDPLVSWSPPSVFTCDFFSQERFNSGSITLSPGVYCGGIKISGSSTVTLSPGVYVIKDGPLTVTSSASLIGDGVTLVFMGNGASASFLGSSKVRLSAATYGPTEGLVLAAGRGEPVVSSVVGGGAQMDLEGTIYLPTHDLSYGGNASTELPASYSLIIARTIKFHGGSNVVVRGDPAQSKVPAKEARTLGIVRLVR